MLLMFDVMLKFVRAFNCRKHLNGVVKKLSILQQNVKRGTLYQPDVYLNAITIDFPRDIFFPEKTSEPIHIISNITF